MRRRLGQRLHTPGEYQSFMKFDALASSIGAGIGARLRSQPDARVHGGSINECYRWDGSEGVIFVKVAPAHQRAMFEAERAGLDELRRERQNLRAKADRLADAIAEMGHSPALLAKLGEVDAQIAAVDRRMDE